MSSHTYQRQLLFEDRAVHVLQRVLPPNALVVETAQRRTRLAVALQERSPQSLTAVRFLRAASNSTHHAHS